MRVLTNLSRMLVLAVLAAPLTGCGDATTVDTKPTAPPITEENAKDMAKEINAGAGAGGMKSPGVAPSRK